MSSSTIKHLNQAINRFHAAFVAEIDPSNPGYGDAEAYFATLASLSRLLHDPSMKKVLAELDTKREVPLGDLIAFMSTYNLRFGPATNSRQLQLYEGLVPMLERVRDEMNKTPGSAPPPPAPGEASNLPAAARGAFQKMPWPQLEAHARQQP